MRRKQFFLSLVLLYIISFVPINKVFADETATSDSSVDDGGFSFEVIRSEKQISETNYFDLKLSPGEKHTIQIKFNNSSEKQLDVLIAINGTKTNSNGVIEYGPTNIEDDKSLKYKFSDVVKGAEEVTIPPKTSVTENYEITMPESEFDGLLVGGFQIQQKPDEKEEAKGKAAVINRYAYVKAIVLRENDTEISPELELNKVYPELRNFRNTIFVNFSNITPTFVEDMTVDIQVTKKGSEQVLYDTKQSGMRMAPNTMIDYPVAMNGEKMVPGDYTAKIKVTTSGDKKWDWTEDFKITDEEADKFNNEDVSLLQEAGFDWKFLSIIIGGIVVVALIIFFVIRKLNQKKRTVKKKSSNKKNTSKNKGMK